MRIHNNSDHHKDQHPALQRQSQRFIMTGKYPKSVQLSCSCKSKSAVIGPDLELTYKHEVSGLLAGLLSASSARCSVGMPTGIAVQIEPEPGLGW
jgi:hypothetical protein